jgi:serine/threonine protein kinase
VHELGLDGGIYYLCMDHVDGADLSALVRARPLPRVLALHIGEQVALAAGARARRSATSAGRSGWCTATSARATSCCRATGEVKLADFGIAKATALQDVTWGRLMKGTFAYLSPEQAAGDPITARSDQFSLGVTLCELLTARRPFDADGALALLAVIRRAELPPGLLDGLPAELAALLRRMLSQRPGDRLPDLAAVARVLADVRRGLPAAGPLELAAWVRAALDGDAPPDDPNAPATEHLG